MRRTQRTYEAILDVLRDGAWHPVDDVEAATHFPSHWVKELAAEGVVDVDEGPVTLIRLRSRVEVIA
jgi:hypothetical protein